MTGTRFEEVQVVSFSFSPITIQHEPAMWSRAHGLSDHQLTDFELKKVRGYVIKRDVYIS